MGTSAKQDTEFRQAITRLDATALVVGTMIGSGIFLVSADILRQVHTPGVMLLVWALSGVITLMGALSYGELAAMFPGPAASTCTCARAFPPCSAISTAGHSSR